VVPASHAASARAGQCSSAAAGVGGHGERRGVSPARVSHGVMTTSMSCSAPGASVTSKSGVAARQPRRPRREGQARLAGVTVAAVVAEHDAVAAPHHRGAQPAARPAHEALHDEDVLEARAEREREAHGGRCRAVVAHGRALVDRLAAHDALAQEADRVAEDDHAPAADQRAGTPLTRSA